MDSQKSDEDATCQRQGVTEPVFWCQKNTSIEGRQASSDFGIHFTDIEGDRLRRCSDSRIAGNSDLIKAQTPEPLSAIMTGVIFAACRRQFLEHPTMYFAGVCRHLRGIQASHGQGNKDLGNP
jgi:hypothetical protein